MKKEMKYPNGGQVIPNLLRKKEAKTKDKRDHKLQGIFDVQCYENVPTVNI